MKKQQFALKNDKIREKFENLKSEAPEKLKENLNLSFSIWLFGAEDLEKSLRRLKNAGYNYVELPGDHHVKELGHSLGRVDNLLKKYDLKVSGVCGLFPPEADMASNDPYKRKRAINYVKNEIKFADEVGGDYLLIVPSAVGRSEAIDNNEYQRSVETAQIIAKYFSNSDIKAAVEPIRSAEVSVINTISEALDYIEDIDNESISNINGDIFHMINEEEHIGEAIIRAGERLTNLHIADSNRAPIGKGMINIDIVIMALYLINYNQEGKYVTGEPLGIGGNSYQLMHGNPDSSKLDFLVKQTINYFKERERALTKQ